MKFEKQLLAAAIAGTLGIAGSAHAAVTLDDGDISDVLTYASEIDVLSSGTTLTEGTAMQQDIQSNLGFGVAAGATRFVRVDLDGAVFAQAFTSADLTVSTDGGGTTVASSQISVVQGGQGESFVIFEFTANDGTNDFSIGADGDVKVNIDNVVVASESSVGATYRLFETGTAASNEGQELASSSQTYATFAPALAVTVGDPMDDLIDVGTNSTLFLAGDTTRTDSSFIGNVNVALASPTPLWKDGDATVAMDIIDTGATLTVTGDFSAVPTDANGDPIPSNVILNTGTTEINANTLTATEATFLVDGSGATNAGPKLFGGTGESGKIEMIVSGETEIPQATYTGSYAPMAPDMADTSVGDIGVLSELDKNGDSEMVNLVLTPTDEGGAFRGFLRIINKSGIAGDVFIRVFNDAGESVAFDLGAVAGQSTSLAANAATGLISVNDLFAAAQAVDASFGLTGDDRKLRLVVEGEFSDIEVNNISVSRDNQAFDTF